MSSLASGVCFSVELIRLAYWESRPTQNERARRLYPGYYDFDFYFGASDPRKVFEAPHQICPFEVAFSMKFGNLTGTRTMLYMSRTSSGPHNRYRRVRQAQPLFNLTLDRSIELGFSPGADMTAPTLESVQAYYDDRVEGKLRDFTNANPRIEAAIQLLTEWAPPTPSRMWRSVAVSGRLLEDGSCMARSRGDWADVSPVSIEVAKTCFRLHNLTYRAGLSERALFPANSISYCSWTSMSTLP